MKVVAFKNEIWDLLRGINENMESVFKPIAETRGLTIMQTRILLEIDQCGKHSVGSLGNVIGLTNGNASSTCKKLEKMGFVQRIRTPEDERVVKVVLSPLGEKTIFEVEKELQEKYKSILESKTDDDYKTMTKGLKKLTSILKEMKEINQ